MLKIERIKSKTPSKKSTPKNEKIKLGKQKFCYFLKLLAKFHSNSVLVKGLTKELENITKEDLEELFNSFGEIKKIVMR